MLLMKKVESKGAEIVIIKLAEMLDEIRENLKSNTGDNR